MKKEKRKKRTSKRECKEKMQIERGRKEKFWKINKKEEKEKKKRGKKRVFV